MEYLSRNSKRVGLVAAIVLSAIFLAIGIKSILNSSDAQAGIAFVFLPVYAGFFFLICWGVIWSLIEIICSVAYRDVDSHWKKRCIKSTIVLIICIVIITPVIVTEYMYKVSKSSYSSPDSLNRIYKSRTYAIKESIVSMNLAENIRCPSDILDKLASENNSAVRYRVAANPNTSVDTLTMLANDSEKYVRMHLSKNPSNPADLMYKLRNDNDPNVREKAVYFSQKRGLIP